ncbi:CsbD family protein [Falsiroseomonas tokyonensis]|uniref:CsbD family protein n=1 Tax=Falsiroseomonas tokyonensis TaxID=430521 RepID=A0ABV7BRF4_9PROT|nr:CsbD family protein [Falsiroseomonas tokyonensis]MBU8537129.1 CsbD family protein [Falsiroseomonas tokyonensis]
MDKDRIKGALNEAKGEVKKTVGEAVGNERLEAEGHLDVAKGKTQKAVGETKDAARDMIDGKNRV